MIQSMRDNRDALTVYLKFLLSYYSGLHPLVLVDMQIH